MDKKKLVYALLKEIESGNKPRSQDFDLTKEEFAEIIELAENGNLLINAEINKGGIYNKVISISLRNAKLTFKGLNYLEENNSLNKTL